MKQIMLLPLVALGADGASSLGEALAASPRAIVCILNYQQTTELFEQSDIAPLLKDRTIIQLSTGSPREADEGAQWFVERGAYYLDGAILGWPGHREDPPAQCHAVAVGPGAGAVEIVPRSDGVAKRHAPDPLGPVIGGGDE